MTITEIHQWRDQRLAESRARARLEQERIRADADRMIRIAIEEASKVEPYQNRIARRLGVQSSVLRHYARRFGAVLPKRPYTREV